MSYGINFLSSDPPAKQQSYFYTPDVAGTFCKCQIYMNWRLISLPNHHNYSQHPKDQYRPTAWVLAPFIPEDALAELPPNWASWKFPTIKKIQTYHGQKKSTKYGVIVFYPHYFATFLHKYITVCWRWAWKQGPKISLGESCKGSCLFWWIEHCNKG